MLSFLLTAALAAAPVPADGPPVTRVFGVAELVVPVPDFALPPREPATRAARWARPTAADAAEELVRQITTVVRPASWEGRGGRGRAEYFETNHALVVTSAPDVVAAVGRHLAGLKRLQDVAVATETRVVTAPAGLAARHGLRPGGILSAAEHAGFLTAAEADPAVVVTLLPKITTFNGQVASFFTGETRQLVTAVDVRVKDGKVDHRPRWTAVELGDRVTLCARVTADEKAVTLRAAVTRTALRGDVVQTPRTDFTPEYPVTTLLEHAETTRVAVEREATRVGPGQTVVVGRWVEPGGREVWVLATPYLIRDTD